MAGPRWSTQSARDRDGRRSRGWQIHSLGSYARPSERRIALDRIGAYRGVAVATVVACAWLIALLPAQAQQRPTLEEVCQSTVCRIPHNVSIRVDGNRVFEVVLPKAPFYFQGVASIALGETLYLQADAVTVTGPLLSYAPANNNSSRTITLTASILESSGKPGTMLKVTNPFSKPLSYRALIHVPGANRFEHTSTCPVMPGLTNYESWPYPIVQFALTDFAFTNQQDATARECK
jgi:hypothetical protein